MWCIWYMYNVLECKCVGLAANYRFNLYSASAKSINSSKAYDFVARCGRIICEDIAISRDV